MSQTLSNAEPQVSSLKGGLSGASPVSFLSASVISRSKISRESPNCKSGVGSAPGQVDLCCTHTLDKNREVKRFI